MKCEKLYAVYIPLQPRQEYWGTALERFGSATKINDKAQSQLLSGMSKIVNKRFILLSFLIIYLSMLFIIACLICSLLVLRYFT